MYDFTAKSSVATLDSMSFINKIVVGDVELFSVCKKSGKSISVNF